MRRHGGFTIVELLVVILIIGILSAIVFSSFNSSRAKFTVKDTAQQIAEDLNKARSATQRRSQDASVTLANDGLSYDILLDGVSTTRVIPSGLVVTVISSTPANSKVISYKAPFGEAVAQAIWKVEYPAFNNAVTYLKVVGVMGKVIVSAD